MYISNILLYRKITTFSVASMWDRDKCGSRFSNYSWSYLNIIDHVNYIKQIPQINKQIYE